MLNFAFDSLRIVMTFLGLYLDISFFRRLIVLLIVLLCVSFVVCLLLGIGFSFHTWCVGFHFSFHRVLLFVTPFGILVLLIVFLILLMFHTSFSLIRLFLCLFLLFHFLFALESLLHYCIKNLFLLLFY